MLKLNLGSGKRPMEGWQNIDAVKHTEETIVGDILNLLYKDESIEEIFSEHVIEHLDRNEANRFFSECNRMLKIGGLLEIVAPDMVGVINRFYNKQPFGEYNTQLVDVDVLDNFLFALHKHPYDYHKQGIYKEKLERWCAEHNFEVVELRCQGQPHSENEIYLKARKRG